MIGENPHDSLTPTSKRRRRPASLGTGTRPRLATRRRKDGSQHTTTLQLAPTWTDRGSQRVTRWRCCIFSAICFPFATPGADIMAVVEASPLPPSKPPPPPTPVGKPPPSLVRHLPLVCGLTTPVPCCHTFCCGMDGGWDSHANAPNSEGRSNAEVPFSSPQCHPLGKAFRGLENCLDLTLPTNVRYSMLVHTDLVSNAKQQVGRQPRHRQRSLDTV